MELLGERSQRAKFHISKDLADAFINPIHSHTQRRLLSVSQHSVVSQSITTDGNVPPYFQYLSLTCPSATST